MGKIHIILTKQHIAHELFSQRGAICSDRPGLSSIYESSSETGKREESPLIGRNGKHSDSNSKTSIQEMSLTLFANNWKNQQKHAHGLIVEALNEKYHHYPSIKAKKMLADMLKDPNNWSKLLENCPPT